MSGVVQLLGSVAAVLLAFGAGWLFRELQLRRKRRKARRLRAKNARRKNKGQPKKGVTSTPHARKEQQRVMPWGPFPTLRKPAKVAAGHPEQELVEEPQREGYLLSMPAEKWLEDTYDGPDQPTEEEVEYNVLPADELEQWRGRVDRKPAKPTKKLNDHEIMEWLMRDVDEEDEAQEK